MKMPIDIPALLFAAFDIEKARKTPVSVNILVDESADPEFQVFVRAGFNSESPNSRVMVSYFPMQTPDTSVACDLVVIAAGTSPHIGEIVEGFNANDVPVLVVAERGDDACRRAEEAGHPLPSDCVVSPRVGQPFDEDIKGSLGDEIGKWIVSAAHEEKRLALSIAYPFVRRPLAYQAIQETSWENAGIGVVVFVPGADFPLMTLNQAKMVLQIAAVYGQPLCADRVKELAGVLANGLVFRGISRTLVGVVPVLGWAIKGAMGYAGTQAIGHAAIEYFENGGNVAGLASVVGKARDGVIAAAATVKGQPAYQLANDTVGPYARKAAVAVLDAAAPVAQSAAKTVFSSVRRRKSK